MKLSFEGALAGHSAALASLPALSSVIDAATAELAAAAKNGGVIYWLGNGGSAADAQHYAAELMVRYTRNREPIASIALTTDTSLLTAHSNDYEYETVFSRQVKALVTEKDVVVGISTSGNSENVLLALQEAKSKGAVTIALLGRDGGRIALQVDYPIIVESTTTAHIQECHLIIGHYMCDCVENRFSDI